MALSGITFLLYFFPVVLTGYYILSFSKTLRNVWLFMLSLVFYAWGEPVYIFLMILSVMFNYVCGVLVSKADKKKYRRIWLIISCLGNLVVPGVFVYSDFVIELINSIYGEARVASLNLLIPLGISIYTLKAMSYVFDVYKGNAKVQKNPIYLGLYISFFPHLLAGPIVRYETFEKQIIDRKTDISLVSEGICRFSEGLVKKILIVDNLAVVADQIFSLSSGGDNVTKTPVMLAWLGAFAFTMQFYFELSSYSDMAIGLGKMFGFTSYENFKYPFMACSVSEFMRRWNISLGEWFDEYVYTPLGGKKSSNKDKMIRNVFVVWLLTGIWYGAGWTYIWWGVTVFAFILFETLFGLEKREGYIGIRRAYVWIVMMITMVIFRSDGGNQIIRYFGNMFGLSDNGFYSPTVYMYVKEYGLVFAAAIVLLFPVKKILCEAFDNNQTKAFRILRTGYQGLYVMGLGALMFFCLVVLVKGEYSQLVFFDI